MEYKTNTKWNVWYHSIRDNNWNNSSYKKIFEITNLYDLFHFTNNINDIHLFNSMLFIMRDGIFPTWEDENNKNGCMFCYKIKSDIILNEFINIIKSLICENIHSDKQKYSLINGISISPKKEFNILKIWVREKSTDKILNYSTNYIKNNNMLYKKN